MSSSKSVKKSTTSLSITSTSADKQSSTTSTLKLESTTVASTSRKRSAGELSSDKNTDVSEERATKVQKSAKIPAMFLPRSAQVAAQASAAFKWLPALALPAHQPRRFLPATAGPSTSTPKAIIPPVGPTTCLYGVHLEQKPTSKVAMFDLDDTLITRKSGKKFSDDPDDWKLWTANVGDKLREAISNGFSIVVISNQAGLPVKDREAKWKQKIPKIAQSALSDVPFRIFAAKEKDGFRKPMLGMWDALVEEFKKENVEIDKAASYFVGDAAGRVKPKDHSAADRKLAHNMGVQFYTPDEYFKGRKEKLPDLLGFHPSKLEATDPIPTLTSSTTSEIVIFVGSPGCGKSSIYKKQFAPAGYVHVNQDKLKDKKKCVKETERVISEGGRCVVDNTNRDKATRAEYIEVAKRLKCPIRCVWFDVPPELAWHNNMYRAFHELAPDVPDVKSTTMVETSTTTIVEDDDKGSSSGSENEEGKPKKKRGRPKKVITTTKTTTTAETTAVAPSSPRKLVPWIAYTSFRSHFQDPELSEGFDKIDKVGFVFEGTEKERERWCTYMEL